MFRIFYASRSHFSSEFTPFLVVFARVLHPVPLENSPKSKFFLIQLHDVPP